MPRGTSASASGTRTERQQERDYRSKECERGRRRATRTPISLGENRPGGSGNVLINLGNFPARGVEARGGGGKDLAVGAGIIVEVKTRHGWS